MGRFTPSLFGTGLDLFPKGDPGEKAGHTTPERALPSLATPVTPAAEALASRAVTPRTAMEVLTYELLAELRDWRTNTTDGLKGIRGQLVNDVLDVELAQFDADGVIMREFRTAVGCVQVVNHTAADVTVTSGPKGAAAPVNGHGAGRVPAGCSNIVHIGSHTVTVYGTPAAYVSLQAFTKSHPPISGPATLQQPYAALRPGTILESANFGAAGAAITDTLPGAVGQMTWITGFDLTWDSSGTGTVNDSILVTCTNTFLYRFATIAGQGGYLPVTFPQPVPASALNTAITVVLGATANRAACSINTHGYRL
jgi:hypothetical protein